MALEKVNTCVTLDLNETNENVIVSANRGDARSRTIQIDLTANGELYPIPEHIKARLMGTRPDGAAILEDCTIQGNRVIYEMTDYVLSVSGEVRAKISLFDAENHQVLSSVAFTIHVPADPFDENAVIHTDEFSALVKALAEVNQAIKSANQALNQAKDATNHANQALENARTAINGANQVIGDCTELKTELRETTAEANRAISDMDSLNETVTNAEKERENKLQELTDHTNAAMSNAEAATQGAVTAAATANQAAEKANESASRAAEAADKAYEAVDKIVSDGLPIATKSSTGVVKAGSQIAVEADGTMKIVAIPEELGSGGVEQFLLLSSLPSVGDSTYLYMVTEDTDDKNGMYYWDEAAAGYVKFEPGSLIKDITSADYQALSEEEKKNGTIYHVVDEEDWMTDILNTYHGHSNKAALDEITEESVKKWNRGIVIEDNLSSSHSDTALSSGQGKILKESMDALEADIAGKSDRSTPLSLTLSAAGWTGSAPPYRNTISVPGATEDNVIEVVTPSEVTARQIEAFRAAQILNGSQAVDAVTLYAWGNVPSIDLPVTVIVRRDVSCQ